EGRIVPGRIPLLLEVEDQRHQRLGDEAAAEDAEHALFVGAGAEGIGQSRLVHRRSPVIGLRAAPCGQHASPSLRPRFAVRCQAARCSAAAATARKNASIKAGSLIPGALSTPDEMSMAGGAATRSAVPTFPALRPPER